MTTGKRNRWGLWLAGFLALAGLREASAELAFDQTLLEVKAKMDDTETKVAFPFINSGKTTVTITDIQTSCGCTAADLPKKNYASGEKGQIGVTFDFGSRVGVQIKSITVKTDDPAQPQISLSLRVEIPDPVKISPRFVFWKKGQSPDPRIVRIEMEHDEPVTIASVQSDDPAIASAVKIIQAGKLYELVLTPQSLDRNVSANITVRTSFADGRVKDHMLFGRIYVPKAPEKNEQSSPGPEASAPIQP